MHGRKVKRDKSRKDMKRLFVAWIALPRTRCSSLYLVVLVFTLIPLNPLNAQYALLNANSGKVIDLPTSCADNDGCQLQQWDYLGGTNQQWQVIPLGNGFNEIVNVYSGKVLDLTAPCAGNDGRQLQQ